MQCMTARKLTHSTQHLHQIIGHFQEKEGFGEVSRDLEMFRGIWRSFEGFGEVSRDLEKF